MKFGKKKKKKKKKWSDGNWAGQTKRFIYRTQKFFSHTNCSTFALKESKIRRIRISVKFGKKKKKKKKKKKMVKWELGRPDKTRSRLRQNLMTVLFLTTCIVLNKGQTNFSNLLNPVASDQDENTRATKRNEQRMPLRSRIRN